MAGKYTLEELLQLRASPLVCKPANLPAIEEFLSTADTAAKRPTARAKPDESTTQPEGFPKRPLLDSQHRKSTTGALPWPFNPSQLISPQIQIELC
jgi:hypothetical protein